MTMTFAGSILVIISPCSGQFRIRPMMIKQNLNLTTSQNLVMTPAMQQAIKILELNYTEMQEYIDQQLLENPLLQASRGEEDDIDGTPDATGLHQDYAEENAGDSEDAPNIAEGLECESYDQAAKAIDSNFENDFDIGYGDRLINMRPDGAYNEDQTPWEERTAGNLSLQEVLQQQIDVALSDPQERLIAATLTDHLDSNGWMIGDTAHIAKELGVDEQKILRVLAVMQQFEPSGIFTRTLAECLRIQLQSAERLDPKMHTLLENLPLLAEGKFSKLMKLCSCDEDLLREMIQNIRRLDPKPAARYDQFMSANIVPDVFARKNLEGEWIVELNDQNLPRLLVDRRYYTRAVAGSSKTIDKVYLSAQFQNAQWLKKALHQRAITILKVSSAVINHQFRFLEHGVSALEPLVLQQIADQIEMHPSTVSRAINNKYISTPRGIFELKYLFQTAIKSNNPRVRFSAEAIRHRTKTLITEEDPSRPVADDALSKILHAEGIKLARRTIAKYREEMRIPPSSKRKRQHLSIL
ncbi:MAG: RNA polymerase factor sigma-54 [Alphaproteobacteria bacterium]|nr:RNA polymerase factor sigma-54 [Alphaproteobacteria bacterium]